MRAIVTTLIVLLPSAVFAQQTGAATFDRLKALTGTWDVTERDNPRTREIAVYTLTGRGSVLVESLESPAMGHMMTAYHLDNDELVLTHFCGAGNQPRMKMTSADDRHIAFTMYDITNLSNAQAYHSTDVDVVFLDRDRVNLLYRGTAAGKRSEQVFQLTRRNTR